jgi:hypothetical protein
MEIGANSPFETLWGSQGEALRQRLMEVLPRLSARRRRLASLLACGAADDPAAAAAQMLDGADPPACAGAASFLRLLRQPNTQTQTLLAGARVADDLTIRLAARQDRQPLADDPPATCWSCSLCANYNDLADVDCRHCDNGTRPQND